MSNIGPITYEVSREAVSTEGEAEGRLRRLWHRLLVRLGLRKPPRITNFFQQNLVAVRAQAEVNGATAATIMMVTEEMLDGGDIRELVEADVRRNFEELAATTAPPAS